jgi:DNA polymerase-3 subunit epsilon
MREIVLDTETTGLDPFQGDRIVEIGCVELLNHVPTGRTYHQYINPERSMPQEAFEVHGLGDEFLADKPKFAHVVDAFLEFIAEDKLVIHNASFDMKFLNAELVRAKRRELAQDRAVDTLMIARKRYPGAGNSLDALCRRFSVDNSGRELHGALLDCQLLAEVYLELRGGRQPDFGLGARPAEETADSTGAGSEWAPPPRPAPLTPLLTEAERQSHEAFIAELGEACRWRRA